MLMQSNPGSSRTSVKCLLVDDQEENLVALSALLVADDVEVLEAHSGAEALELLLAHDGSVDVQSPDPTHTVFEVRVPRRATRS